ncbi:hypothetical protein M0802_013776 [Mischocyttarus mexicanus]|nr:hypothetical protein M0802_013779 [Mischocyttarus mexicanus]KAI4482173.1 hypothetical protein M0802_013776 [Mischocyttarus mexicanus]
MIFFSPNEYILFLFPEFYYVWDTTKVNIDNANNGIRKKFPCPNCPSAFGQKASLTRHLRYECGQEPRFQCPYCHHRSKKTSDVYSHIRRKHTEFKVFAIDIHNDFNKKECVLKCFKRKTIKWYTYYPERTKPYQCLNCPNSYSKKVHLKRHMITACNGKEPRYKCPYCVYKSRYPSDTYKHVKRIHEEYMVYAIDIISMRNCIPRSIQNCIPRIQ